MALLDKKDNVSRFTSVYLGINYNYYYELQLLQVGAASSFFSVALKHYGYEKAKKYLKVVCLSL